MAKNNGFTKFSNDFWSNIAKLNMNGSEHAVFDILVRNTLCFNRSETALSYSFIANGTGLNCKTAMRALKGLVEKGIAKIKVPAVGTHPQIVEIRVDKNGYCRVDKNGVDNFGQKDWTVLSEKSGQFCPERVDSFVHQENKDKKNKDKEIKEKKRDFSLFLPKSIQKKDVDDMSEEEFGIWLETRERFERGEFDNVDIPV